MNMSTEGVFLAEPVSNVIGGSACFLTMLFTVLPELKRMERIRLITRKWHILSKVEIM